MSTNIKGAYERKFLEILLRHDLPDDCEVRIEVSNPPPARATLAADGSAVFSLKGGAVNVRSNIDKSGLRRLIVAEPHCW